MLPRSKRAMAPRALTHFGLQDVVGAVAFEVAPNWSQDLSLVLRAGECSLRNDSARHTWEAPAIGTIVG